MADPDEEKPKPKPKAKPGDGDQNDRGVSLETEWAKLSRAHALAKSRQADLENKLYRAEMLASSVEAGYGNDIVILDPAFRPSGPSNAPNRTVVMMGLAASIAVGFVISAAWGLFLDDRLFSARRGRGQRHGAGLRHGPRDRRKEKGKDKRKTPPAAGSATERPPPRAPAEPDARGLSRA